MIRYHGGPITPETSAVRVWTGRHAFISWEEPRQINVAASLCESFAIDNGAFTVWKAGLPAPHWPNYYEWAAKWLRHPACDWAVIPDVIGGTEAENDELISLWPFGHRGVPVWHLNESIDRLERLAAAWPRIALGSTAEFNVSSPSACVARLREALRPICDADGFPLVKLHGLRMLRPEIVTRIPLASGDSANVARNINIDKAWKGTYQPATKEARADVLVNRMESHLTPAFFDFETP